MDKDERGSNKPLSVSLFYESILILKKHKTTCIESCKKLKRELYENMKYTIRVSNANHH